MTPALTPEQQHAVDIQAPVVEIHAGAGCGKTITLLHRAIAEAQDAQRVLVLTFSRAAAREFAVRLGTLLTHGYRWGSRDKDRIHVSTLHAWAASIVQRHSPKQRTIIDDIDAERVRREALAAQVSEETALERLGLLRYRDLVPAATELLRRADVAWEECGGVILVDEAHDVDAEQWQLLRALRPDRLVYVLDHAQRVYSWRGACPPPRWWSGSDFRRVQLTRNFRSHPVVLDAANQIPIDGRVDLVAATKPTGDGYVVVHEEEDEERLLQATVDRVQWGDGSHAVLTRTRSRARAVVDALEEAGITVHAPGLTEPILDQPRGRAVLDLLHVAQDPMDSVHLARVLDACGVDQRGMLVLQQRRAALACSLWEAVIHRDEYEQLPQLAQDTLHKLWEAGAGADAYGLLGDLPPLLVDRDVVDVLPGGSVSDVLLWSADPDRVVSTRAPDGAVHVSTIHAAKGLEFDHVIVHGCEDGSIPLLRKGSDMAEERRLMYVAITRARSTVALLWARYSERGKERRPSRFLREVGMGSRHVARGVRAERG